MSGPQRRVPERACPECGALLPAQATECWLCRIAVAPEETEGAAPHVAGPAMTGSEAPFAAPSAAHHAYLQFSLASLMLTITLCAVLFGAAAVLPGLGIVLAILAAPAFIHTAVTAVRRRERGRQMDAMQKTVFFCGSLGAVVVTLVAAGIAFFATCFGGFFAGAAVGEKMGAKGYDPIGWGLVTGIALGILAGLVVLVLLIRLFVKIYRRRSA